MKWGLACSGGGAPGIAGHLGVLSALEDGGLTPDVIVGASAGGLVAGLWAQGATVQQMVSAWRAVAASTWELVPQEALRLLGFCHPSGTPGLLDLAPVVRRVWSALGFRMWPVCTPAGWVPGCGVVISDLTTGCAMVAHRGMPSAAAYDSLGLLTATAAIPGLFSGIRDHNGHLLCDGGLFDDSPVQAARDLGADKVVLVRIGGGTPTIPSGLSTADLLRIVVTEGLSHTDRAANPNPPDLRVEVATSGAVLAFTHWGSDYQAGAAAAAQHIDAIRALASN